LQKPDPTSITILLKAAGDGDPNALDRLFPMVYDELKRRAKSERRRLGGHATMNTTALVNEAYLKLAARDEHDFENRAHFYAVAAKAMRHIFLDYAKRKTAVKRGGEAVRVDQDPAALADVHPSPVDLRIEQAEEVLRLEKALERLEDRDPRKVRVVECRFFGGLTIDDTAAALGISPATVKRDWAGAQVALYRDLAGTP
jgi:RNA polymerase sigma factor (TIGR02999 family)